MEKTICVTGHRHIPSAKLHYIKRELQREIAQAIREGFTRFISGFAEGVDLEFAAMVADLKDSNPCIFLEAALPFPDRFNTKDKLFHQLIHKCDEIEIVSQEYTPGCYRARNLYMVNASDRVIAVYDGRNRSGTAQTIRLAQEKGCDLRMIDISL